MILTTKTIFVGNVGNDGTGDNLRTAFIKTNDNFGNIANYLLNGGVQVDRLTASSQSLVLHADGVVSLPHGLLDYNGGYSRFKDAVNTGVQLGSPDDQNYVNVDNTAVTIQVNSDALAGKTQYNWLFDTNGTLTLPPRGNLIVSGNVTIGGSLSVTGNIITRNYEIVTYTEFANAVVATGDITTTSKFVTTGGVFWANGVSYLSAASGQIATETQDRIAGNVVVAGQIATETQDRIAGNVVVAGQIATERADRIAGNVVVAGQIATERADRIAGNVAMRQYVDRSDYLNLPPLAGVLSENYVPLYSDFKFSLGAQSTYAFFSTNSQGFQVVYFHADTPTGLVRPFRAYRFVSTDEFIYDTEPVSVTFLNTNEYVDAIYNMGTRFAFLSITNSVTTAVKRVLALTNGNNKSSTWTLYLDVTSITGGSTNVFLLQDSGGDRILRTTMGSTAITLDVYDNTKTLLRSQQLFSSSEVSGTDYTGSGKTVTDTALPFGYNPWGTAFAFTWNKFTETFIMKAVGYYTWQQGTSNAGQDFGTTVLWNIPKSWLVGGTGSPSNLIPLKSSGYRYHKLPDTTWNTVTGGMGEGFGTAGQAPCVITDEYAKTVNIGIVGTWDTKGFQIYSFPYTLAQTIGSSLTATYSKNVGIPDASAWSKRAMAYWGHIIDDNVLFSGDSVQYGSKTIAANFSSTQFTTAYSANDTLKLNPVTSKIEDPSAVISNANTSYGITSVAGTPVAYSATPGRVLYTITVAAGSRVYTSTGFTIPAIPATIGAVGDIALAGNTVYNGVDGDKKFWSVVSGPAHQFYIAHYSSGGWNNIYGPFVGTEIAAGNAARGDSANSWGVYNGTSCLTANGRFLHYIEVYVPGGAFFKILEFNVNTNSMTVHEWNKFDRTIPSTYSGVGPWYGVSFGFSTLFGYYCMISTERQTSTLISSSRNVVTGATHTEEEWFADGTGRYDMNISAEATVGLSIYLKAYPLFIGGYYNSVPDMVLTVPANSTSYVYAELLGDDRRDLVVTAGTDYVPSSFTRVLLGTVVTNGERVTSSTSNRISNGSVDIASLKSIAAASTTFADFKTAILAL